MRPTIVPNAIPNGQVTDFSVAACAITQKRQPLADPSHDKKTRWMAQLTGDAGAVMRSGGFWALVGKVGGEAIVSRWMAQLTGDAGAVMRSGSFWALVGKVGGEANVSRWIINVQGSTTCESLWTLLGKPGGEEYLLQHYRIGMSARELDKLKSNFKTRES